MSVLVGAKHEHPRGAGSGSNEIQRAGANSATRPANPKSTAHQEST